LKPAVVKAFSERVYRLAYGKLSNDGFDFAKFAFTFVATKPKHLRLSNQVYNESLSIQHSHFACLACFIFLLV
jgi:hypothetical protein